MLSTEGDVYTWGRGLYGVLGNGSNTHKLTPFFNEDIRAITEEDEGSKIIKMDSADEYTVIQLKDGTLYSWGKNDRGQLGTGAGIGMDMVECENIPTMVDLRDEDEVPKLTKKFAMG